MSAFVTISSDESNRGRTENGVIHNPEDVTRSDTIVWNNVTGDVLTEDQQQAMIDYLETGGGWVGIHGAGDSSSEWSWYKDVGRRRVYRPPHEPQFQQAKVLIENTDDPVVEHLAGR